MRFILVLLALSAAPAFATDAEDIKSCLNHWSEHPFKGEHPKFRVMASRVKVVGIGDEAADTQKTTSPELVLVKPNVTVMGKTKVTRIGCKE